MGWLSVKVHVGEQNPDPVPRPTGTHCLTHPPSLRQCSACTSGVCGVCICLYLCVRGCVFICVGGTPWQKAQADLVAMSAPQAARLKPQSGEVYRGPWSSSLGWAHRCARLATGTRGPQPREGPLV